MSTNKFINKLIFSILIVSVLIFSQSTLALADDDSENIIRPEGWSEETHSNDVEPNYEIVFPDDEVNTITITISPENWSAMQENMNSLVSSSNTNQRGGGRNNQQQEKTSFLSENPMWVSSTVEFDGTVWTNVGIRYKGNSSLRSAWQSGSLKMPFKLDFDEFEDDYPEIDDQRFYGFKQLSFANSFNDNTYMRDVLSSDVYQAAGLPVAEAAFYEVVLDYGEGPVSLGLYTLNEVVDDTVIESYFGDDDGNIYEGDGTAASLSWNSFNYIEDSFQKENNEEEADWSDIQELYSILHSDLRKTDPDAWKKILEASFDVESFLKWLATSAVIQHWDTYGSMTHNYYLYHDPETDLLNWITWDHNETFTVSGNSGTSFGKMNKTVSFDKSDVSDEWPLISYLLDNAEYYEAYLGFIEEIMNEVYVSEDLIEIINSYEELIAPYLTTNNNANRFSTAVNELINNISSQEDLVWKFIDSN